jgi:hypothetical protein
MTEEKWLANTDPGVMVKSLAGLLRKTKAFPRKDAQFRRYRLFGVAACRRLWPLLHANNRRAVELSEEYAETSNKTLLLDAVRVFCSGNPDAVALASHGIEHYPDMGAMYRSWARSEADQAVQHVVNSRAPVAARAHFRALRALGSQESADQLDGRIEPLRPIGTCPQSAREASVQVCLLRDIFGNPFRPVAFDPAWRTDTAVSLAKGMYESRDFGAMPILADALQDAGCDSADILDHCRDAGGPHVRGCWVVDLVLGKE